MDVVSVCPLRVASVSWRPEHGQHSLTVVCRGTFRLTAGCMKPADVQLPPSRKDQYLRPTGQSSLVVPSDLVPGKRGVDVVLVGHARAPSAQPVASFPARLVVGSVDKRIEVFAERFFTPAGELVQAARVAEVPMSWERAAGGPGTPNPVGVRVTQRDSLGRVALPQLQPLGLRVTDAEQAIPAVCFGPIAASWPGRLTHLGTHASDWSSERWWARPLPEGVDLRYFNVAPDDQRLERLAGDEPVVLENVLESESELRTRLPGFAPIGTLTRRRGKPEPLELTADTVWIDTDRAVCTITWRGHVTLWHPSEQGRIEIDWAEGPPRAAAAPAAPPAIETARGIGVRWLAMPVDDPDGGVTEPSYLPDDDEPGPGAPAATVPAAGDGSAGTGGEPAPSKGRFDGDETVPGGAAVSRPPLPFQRPRPGALPVPMANGAPNGGPPTEHMRIGASPRESTAVTRMPSDGSDAPPLPFRSAGGNDAADAPRSSAAPDETLPFRQAVPPGTPTAPGVRLPGRPSTPAPPPLVRPASLGPSVPIPPPRPSSPWAGAEGVGRSASGGGRASSSPRPPATPEANGGEPPAPPPLIGPLATPEMVARQSVAEGSPSPAVEAADEGSSPPAPPEEQPTAASDAAKLAIYEPGPGLRLLRIEACARVAALCARRPDEEPQLLAEHGLDVPSWKANEAYWAERIREETARGRALLLRQYDAGYVASLERARGPIDADQYAKLVVAAERGQGARALRELDLPAGAMVRLERVFLRRVVDNATLGEKIRKAIDTERGS